ncbi:DUF551 domain-containing protein [Enterobacter mori]|uniref:DUF551 domain-containing protein n=1 Tax=Enterobacter mori TaxID=539813 RepID=UPI002A840A24|nr:DUF551 domain-containing protein [Enterobacter mori]
MSNIDKRWYRADGGDIGAGRLKEIADNVYGDEEKCWLAKRVLASLEAEPAIHRWRRVTVEPYGPYPWHYGNFIGFSQPVDGIEDEYFYSVPPAPVSVPDLLEQFAEFMAAESIKSGDYPDGWQSKASNAAHEYAQNTRASMLQGAEPVTTAYKLRDAVEIIRNSGIAIDAEKILAERDALSAPVIADGWVACSERMPEVGVKVLCFPVNDEPIHATYNGQVWLQDISWSVSDESIDNVISCNVFHWMPLPAAPQQEA